MAYGITFKSPAAFSGDFVDSLPVIEGPIYPLPVSGSSARLLATHQVKGSGASTSWGSVEGASMTLVVAAGKTGPALSVVDGRKVLSFDGVDNLLEAGFAAKSQPYSVALVAKVTGHSGSSVTSAIVGGAPAGVARSVGGGGEIGYTSTGLTLYGGKVSAIAGPGLGGVEPNGWHVIVVAFNGADSKSQVDAYVRTRDAGTISRGGLSVGGSSGSVPARADVAEIVTWDKALTAPEIAGVVAAMREHYGI